MQYCDRGIVPSVYHGQGQLHLRTLDCALRQNNGHRKLCQTLSDHLLNTSLVQVWYRLKAGRMQEGEESLKNMQPEGRLPYAHCEHARAI